jgi:hypothetical protein
MMLRLCFRYLNYSILTLFNKFSGLILHLKNVLVPARAECFVRLKAE